MFDVKKSLGFFIGFSLLSFSGFAKDIPEVRYCTVKSSDDSLNSVLTLRSKVELGFNRKEDQARECTEEIGFDPKQNFDIHLKKTLYFNAPWDINDDVDEPQGDEYNMVFEGHSQNIPHSVTIQGNLLDPDECVLKINADNVKLLNFKVIAYKYDKAICVENGNSVDSSGVTIWLYDDPDHDNVPTGEGDNCPSIANEDQADSEKDGVGDACDVCPKDKNPSHQQKYQCHNPLPPGPQDYKPVPLKDTDGDQIPDLYDNCVAIGNADQLDTDKDGLGDACDGCPKDDDIKHQEKGSCVKNDKAPPPPPKEDPNSDTDSDGILDGVDNCPDVANNSMEDMQSDGDADGVGDACDNCPEAANADQLDTDADGQGDVCSASGGETPGPKDPNDQDSDGVANDSDNCPTISNADQANGDGDKLGDACDPSPGESSNPDEGTPGTFENVNSGTNSGCALISTNSSASAYGLMGLLFSLSFLIFKRTKMTR